MWLKGQAGAAKESVKELALSRDGRQRLANAMLQLIHVGWTRTRETVVLRMSPAKLCRVELGRVRGEESELEPSVAGPSHQTTSRRPRNDDVHLGPRPDGLETTTSIADHPRSVLATALSISDHPRNVVRPPPSMSDHPRSVLKTTPSMSDHSRNVLTTPPSISDRPLPRRSHVARDAR